MARRKGAVKVIDAARLATTDDSALIALQATRYLREQTLREWEQQLVNELRESGVTWETIGLTLGISRQAAEKMYGGAGGRSAQREARPAPAIVSLRSRRRA